MRHSKNISSHYRISANMYYLRDLINLILKFRKTYRNYHEVIIKYLKKEYPIKLILKDGKHHVASNSHSVYFISSVQEHELDYDLSNDTVMISSLPWISIKKNLVFYGAVTNGDLINVYLRNDYNALPVRDKMVLDVGSNIGDSSIYFAIRGASKVIGVEPFPKNYELSKKNVEANGFTDKIKIILAGCSSNSGFITIDPSFESNVDSQISKMTKGMKIPLMTLTEIINNYEIPQGSILKMDCEGCEYDSILFASDETLKKFSHILIEYHFGYEDLKEKLENCGFTVSITSPVSSGFIGNYFRILREIFNHKRNQLRLDQIVESQKNTTDQFNSAYIGTILAIQDFGK